MNKIYEKMCAVAAMAHVTTAVAVFSAITAVGIPHPAEAAARLPKCSAISNTTCDKYKNPTYCCQDKARQGDHKGKFMKGYKKCVKKTILGGGVEGKAMTVKIKIVDVPMPKAIECTDAELPSDYYFKKHKVRPPKEETANNLIDGTASALEADDGSLDAVFDVLQEE